MKKKISLIFSTVGSKELFRIYLGGVILPILNNWKKDWYHFADDLFGPYCYMKGRFWYHLQKDQYVYLKGILMANH